MTQNRLKPRASLLAFLLTLCYLVVSPMIVSARGFDQAHGSGIGSGSSGNQHGKASISTFTPSAQFIADKLAGKIGFNARGHEASVASPNALPSSYYLNTSYADWIIEPPSSGKDARGNSYVDGLFGLFCGPGAAAVSLDYWSNVNTRAVGLHSYSTPRSTTWWQDSGNPGGLKDTSYMMYLATQVRPPSYVYGPGMMTWAGYNSSTYEQDLLDALNWEQSNHASTYRTNPFYLAQSNPTVANLQSMVQSDIYLKGIPPIALVNDAYLPDWQNSPYKGHGHYIAIIGYDNNAGTVTYEETCTSQTCGTSATGRHTTSQQNMVNAINAWGGVLIW